MSLRIHLSYVTGQRTLLERVYRLSVSESIHICSASIPTARLGQVFRLGDVSRRLHLHLTTDEDNGLHLEVVSETEPEIYWGRLAAENAVRRSDTVKLVGERHELHLGDPALNGAKLVLQIEEYFLEEFPELQNIYNITGRMNANRSLYCVYKAKSCMDKSSGEWLEFALKVPAHRARRYFSGANYRYLQSMRVLEYISGHPGIPPALEFMKKENNACVVMPWVNGENLMELLRDDCSRRHLFSLREILELMKKLATTLAYLHANNIIHRGIVPANIIVERVAKRVYLVGFGLAKQLSAAEYVQECQNSLDNSLTEDQPVHFLNFMPPEFFSRDKYDTRWDIYSLGAVFYKMLFFCGPHQCLMSEDQLKNVKRRIDVYKSFFQGGMAPLTVRQTCEYFTEKLRQSRKPIWELILERLRLPEDLLDKLDRLVGKCLQLKAEDRYAKAEDFIEALDAFIKDFTLYERRHGLFEDLERIQLFQGVRANIISQTQYENILRIYQHSLLQATMAAPFPDILEFAQQQGLISAAQKEELGQRAITVPEEAGYLRTPPGFARYYEFKRKRRQERLAMLERELKKTKDELGRQENQAEQTFLRETMERPPEEQSRDLLAVIQGRFTLGMTLPGLGSFIYRLDRMLGRGGMGTVYQATELTTGQVVAVKTYELTPDVDTEGIKGLMRFILEGYTMSGLNEPHLVKALDIQNIGLRYYVMEFVPGQDLGKWLNELPTPCPQPVAREIIRQAALGLAYLHQHGIVHRDIKLQNLMRVENNDGTFTIKIVDFGILRNQSLAIQLTEPGSFLGTLPYSAPELLLTENDAPTAQTDIYSLGVVYYALYHKCFPVYGKNFRELWEGHRANENDTAIDYARVPVPDQTVIRKMLAHHPQDRYLSCTELLDELARLLLECV